MGLDGWLAGDFYFYFHGLSEHVQRSFFYDCLPRIPVIRPFVVAVIDDVSFILYKKKNDLPMEG